VSTNGGSTPLQHPLGGSGWHVAFVDLGTADAYHSIYDDRKAGAAPLVSVAAVDETIEQ